MPIPLNDGAGAAGYPVVKRQRIGETFVGAVVRTEQRPVLKDGEQVLKPNGKPRMELVVTALAMPGTTAPAGIRDNTAVPAPGDRVRLILRGGAFGQWIEAGDALGGLQVGDVVTQVTEWAQAYDANGGPKGPKMTTQAEIDALPRSTTVGIYGPLTLRRAAPGEESWVTAAEAAYRDTAERIALDDDTATPPSVAGLV